MEEIKDRLIKNIYVETISGELKPIHKLTTNEQLEFIFLIKKTNEFYSQINKKK